jgi:hypothetical protein
MKCLVFVRFWRKARNRGEFRSADW